MIRIDPTASVSPLADIEDSTRGTSIVIGPGVMIDSFVKIKPVGGDGDVIIGPNCYVNSGTVVYSGHGVLLESDVLVAANCTLAATNHEFGDRETLIRHQGFQPSRGGIVIERDVWLGAGCVILDGTQIGRGSVVAAGSVVRGLLEPYGLYAGRPVVMIGSRR
jgi:acetyltransferase-like isoleucine patch superfamily enzyme